MLNGCSPEPDTVLTASSDREYVADHLVIVQFSLYGVLHASFARVNRQYQTANYVQ